MVTKEIVYNKLDDKIKAILLTTNGWLVGGAIGQIGYGKEVSDYDIIVPDRKYFHFIVTSLSANHHFTINNYGGFKFVIDGIDVDIWCEELSHFIGTANKITYMYNHKSCVLLNVQ